MDRAVGRRIRALVLAQQMKIPNQPYDSLDQKWAGGAGGTNDLLTDVSLEGVELGSGRFSIKIVDTERKININTATEQRTAPRTRAHARGVDASDAPTIIGSIQDWIDRDSDTTSTARRMIITRV